ncbi:MAG: hypothetical protein AAF292_18265 [Pseudomonadota bacterium]
MSFYQYEIDDPIYVFDQPDFLDLDNVKFERLAQERCIIGLTNSSSAVVERAFANDPDHVGLHVTRDPRQFLASSYFHHLEGHPTESDVWHWEKLASDRARLQTLSQEDGLIYEMDNIAGDILDRQFRAWVRRSNILEVKLEEADTELSALMQQLSGFLGLDLSSIIPRVEARQANPQAQNWQAVFTPRIVDEFKFRFNDVLVDWGYENDDSWTVDTFLHQSPTISAL